MQGFGGETGRKEHLGSTRHRWEDNIRMDHEVIGVVGRGLNFSRPISGQVAEPCLHGFHKMRGILDNVKSR